MSITIKSLLEQYIELVMSGICLSEVDRNESEEKYLKASKLFLENVPLPNSKKDASLLKVLKEKLSSLVEYYEQNGAMPPDFYDVSPQEAIKKLSLIGGYNVIDDNIESLF